MMRYRFPALAVALFIASTAPASADPISASIVAIIGLTGTAAAVATFAITTAISIGLSYAASALMGGKGGGGSAAEQNPFGIKSVLQSGGTVPRSFGFGRFCTGGSEIYPARTWGESGKTPNAYLTRFIALSDLPIDGLTAVIVDDQICTYGSGSPHADLGYAIPEYNNGSDHLWVKFYDGTQTAADSWAVSQFGSDPDYPYGSDQIGYGVAYAIVTALVDQTLFSSFPQFRFECTGAAFYDPREDSTVGGSGSQRWATPSTWALTYNPAVIKYNVLRGISYDGQWLYGLQGTDEGRLPLDSWFAAMNVCDSSVATAPGVYAEQFQCGGECVVNSQPIEFLDELNKCDNGRIAEAGGIFKTRSGAVGSSVMSFTDADLIVTEPQTFDQFPGLESTINAIAATYPDPDQNWAMTDAPALYDADLEAADGDRRLVSSVAYNFVSSNAQVQRLMKSARDEARKFRKHTVIAPPSAFALEPLDVISWTSTANGYTSKLFSVVPTDQDNIDQGLSLIEVDAGDYDWTPAADYTDFTPVEVVSRSPAAQTMSGFSVSATTLNGAGSRSRAAIRLEWGTTGIVDVDGVQYEVRLDAGDVFVVSGETDDFARGYAYISHNILSATNYEVRARYRAASRNRETSWSSWLTVTTDNAQIVANDIADAILTYGKFAAGIKPVQVVGALVDAVAAEGNVAVLTTTGKLYRYYSGAWTTTVPAVDVGNGLTSAQIASVAAAVITGTLTGSQIAAATISAANIVSGTITASQIAASTITSSQIAADTITSGNIAANAITSAEVAADAIVAGKIAAGAVNADTILASNVIVTGHLVANSVSVADTASASGDASLTVTISSNTYQAIIFISIEATVYGTLFELKKNGSSFSPVELITANLSARAFYIDAPAAGSTTYAIFPYGGGSSASSSSITVLQLKR